MIMWKIGGCSVQGLGHIDDDIPCQDKIYSERKNGVTAIALADGAGSARLSHIGANTAVISVCRKLCRDFQRLVSNDDVRAVKAEIAEYVINALKADTEEYSCTLHDLSSTLLAVASDDRYVMTIHVGDGVIGYFRDGVLVPASKPSNGEFRNETVFITNRGIEGHMKLLRGRTDKITGFVLMSDGTAESFYERRSEKLMPVLYGLKNKCLINRGREFNIFLKKYFESVIRYHHTRDDCSMIMMCRPKNTGLLNRSAMCMRRKDSRRYILKLSSAGRYKSLNAG